MPVEIRVGSPVITINQGSTFMVTDQRGEIDSESEQGVSRRPGNYRRKCSYPGDAYCSPDPLLPDQDRHGARRLGVIEEIKLSALFRCEHRRNILLRC